MKVKTLNIPQIMLIFLDFQKSSTQINRYTPYEVMSLAFPFTHYLDTSLDRIGQHAQEAGHCLVPGRPAHPSGAISSSLLLKFGLEISP